MLKVTSAILAAALFGYFLCLGVHRHDAGEDFRRGTVYGHNEVSVSYECGTEEFEKKFPLVHDLQFNPKGKPDGRF
jgi:hypothetical protein